MILKIVNFGNQQVTFVSEWRAHEKSLWDPPNIPLYFFFLFQGFFLQIHNIFCTENQICGISSQGNCKSLYFFWFPGTRRLEKIPAELSGSFVFLDLFRRIQAGKYLQRGHFLRRFRWPESRWDPCRNWSCLPHRCLRSSEPPEEMTSLQVLTSLNPPEQIQKQKKPESRQGSSPAPCAWKPRKI